MQTFETYRDFLQSEYKDWVPSWEDRGEPEREVELLDSPCVLFAYTDYGGDFFDRVSCQFLEEHGEDNRILTQTTIFFGQNLLYIGELPDFESYPLSNYPTIGEDVEEYYYAKEREAEEESFQYMLNEELGDRSRLKSWALAQLLEHKSGHYSPQPDGTIDFCWDDVMAWLKSQPRRLASA